MAKYVRLEYQFEFDPTELWATKSEFDKKLGEFFATLDVEAEYVQFIGAPSLSLLCLKKKQMPSIPKPVKEKSVVQSFKALRPKKK